MHLLYSISPPRLHPYTGAMEQVQIQLPKEVRKFLEERFKSNLRVRICAVTDYVNALLHVMTTKSDYDIYNVDGWHILHMWHGIDNWALIIKITKYGWIEECYVATS